LKILKYKEKNGLEYCLINDKQIYLRANAGLWGFFLNSFFCELLPLNMKYPIAENKCKGFQFTVSK